MTQVDTQPLTLTLTFASFEDYWTPFLGGQGPAWRGSRLDAHEMRVLTFDEIRRPSLIGTPGGEDVPIAGRIWIDAESGAVRQTAVRLEVAGRRGEPVTRFRAEFGFSVLVPDYIWEWYDGRGFSMVECLARYSSYRRFTVETRTNPVRR